MLPYWLLFLLPSVGALLGLGQHRDGRRRDQAFLVLLFLIFAVVIGLRQCGGDFYNYVGNVDVIERERFTTSIQHGDPAFTVLAELANALGWRIYGVNIGCGLMFLYGLLRFVRTLPDPWLAIAAAVPYMVIVIAMGYIRQGAAIGFFLLAFVDIDRRAFGWMTFHVAMALLFHIASLCLLPLIGLSIMRRQPVVLALLTIVGVAVFAFILRERWSGLYQGYVATKYDSSGALVRLLMNAVPATVFLAFRRRFPISDTAKLLWTLVSVLSLLMLPTLALANSSTWIDRIGLFFSPIQLVVFGYLTTLFASDPREQRIAQFLAILFYGAVLYVWLNYATNAYAWVPYRWVISSWGAA